MFDNVAYLLNNFHNNLLLDYKLIRTNWVVRKPFMVASYQNALPNVININVSWITLCLCSNVWSDKRSIKQIEFKLHILCIILKVLCNVPFIFNKRWMYNQKWLHHVNGVKVRLSKLKSTDFLEFINRFLQNICSNLGL